MRTMPGVQKPHCTAPWSMNACCTGCNLAALCQSLDSQDLLVADGYGQRAARQYWQAVNQHRARAAFPAAARFFRPREMQLLSQKICQRNAGTFENHLVNFAIYRKLTISPLTLLSAISVPACFSGYLRQCPTHEYSGHFSSVVSGRAQIRNRSGARRCGLGCRGNSLRIQFLAA